MNRNINAFKIEWFKMIWISDINQKPHKGLQLLLKYGGNIAVHYNRDFM